MQTMDKIDSRTRVMRAISHSETDRLPRNFRAEQPIVQALLERLSLHSEEDLKAFFRSDMERLRVKYDGNFVNGIDIWGVQHTAKEQVIVAQTHPLAQANCVEDILRYRWPNPDIADIAAFRTDAVEARKTGRAVVGSSWGAIYSTASDPTGRTRYTRTI